MSDLVQLTSKLQSGDKLSTEQRLEVLHELKDRLEAGYFSVRQIAEHYGIAFNTALAWRKAALALIEKDNQGLNRMAIKHMQQGRIMANIESLMADLKSTTDIKERMMIHQRINAYYDTLHRITGLNTETLQIEHQLKPLQINMPTNVVEGTIVPEPVSPDKSLPKPQAD